MNNVIKETLTFDLWASFLVGYMGLMLEAVRVAVMSPH